MGIAGALRGTVAGLDAIADRVVARADRALSPAPAAADGQGSGSPW